MNRLEVREQVLTCVQCDLHRRCRAPVPFSGPTPSPIAVLGEAPGRDEDQEGKPFVGRAGKKLRELLLDVGIDPSQLTFINTASCLPLTQEGKQRAPSATEVAACSSNRELQLELSGATHVLLTGNVPLQAYRPDLRISRARGHPFVRRKTGMTEVGRVFFPVLHPAAVLRNPNWEVDLLGDLKTFRDLAAAVTSSWMDFIPPTCVRCGLSEDDMEWMRYDNDGLMFCNKCWPVSPQGRNE